MSERKEALWLVIKILTVGQTRKVLKHWVFRSRAAARKAVKAKTKTGLGIKYTVARAHWG